MRLSTWTASDVVLLIPMIPPPFFPVPFTHSMDRPGSTWLNLWADLFTTTFLLLNSDKTGSGSWCIYTRYTGRHHALGLGLGLNHKIVILAAICFMLSRWSKIKTQLGKRASRIHNTLFMLRRMSALCIAWKWPTLWCWQPFFYVN